MFSFCRNVWHVAIFGCDIALTTRHCKGMAARSGVDEIRLHHSSRYMLRVRHFTDQDAALQTLPWQTLTS